MTTKVIDKNIISLAQIEVWEMKEKIYESVKDLTLKEALFKILNHSKELTNKFLLDAKSKNSA